MIKIISISQQKFHSFISDYDNICTEQINKIALSSNDDRIFDKLQPIHTEQTHLKYAKVRC